MAHYAQRLDGIPVKRAAEILKQFGAGDEKFWWVYKDAKKFAWTANRVGETGLRNLAAKSINIIKFIGGPPGNRQLFSGTLLTLLLDRLLRVVVEEGLQGLDGIVDVTEVYA